ncbi:hypothetical protein [Vibrio diazotrophicus]|uniref:hypothetical protein n=1 Tax=Vibrio diazotrophicus TaxID=685 RepID=UPI000C9E6A83|nr:hypothetical protein [Vibrio diazotrophicus]PNH91324.1 hypothetical protein C1M59_14565 [Vibrio diazotrophicus]
MIKLCKRLALVSVFFASMGLSADENLIKDPMELKMKVVMVPKSGQSMHTLGIGPIELFRNAKKGVTAFSYDKDFTLVHVVKSKGSTSDLPTYDVMFTYVSNVFDGTNEPSGYIETMSPSKLIIVKTNESKILEYKFENVPLGTPIQQNKIGEDNLSSRVELEIQ